MILKDLLIRDGSGDGPNGSAGRDGHPGLGGAVFVVYGGHLSAEDVTFEGNTAFGGSGGDAFGPVGGHGDRGGIYYTPFIGSTIDVPAGTGKSVGSATGGGRGNFRDGTP
ncbi:hypothetical protein OAN94_01255 [Verrucomicrobiales bacterium]|nr:hypothetical protein [Verrucomicrobiales bacterium]